MKKFLTIAAFMLFGISSAQADVKIGATLKAGVFEVTEASEEFTGAHSSGASPGDVKKNASSEGDEAKGEFAFGSIFVELSANDKVAVGIDYVPMTLESETTENIQKSSDSSAAGSNTVQVDFEDLTTVYALLYATENLYLKAGYTEVSVVTNESLATGGAYGNATLDGYTVGIGYNHTMDNDMFVRIETSYMEIGGTTLTNKNDSNKKVTADDITGYSAAISVGKSF